MVKFADSGKLHSMLRMVLLWPLKVGAISAVLWFFLREKLPVPADVITSVISGIFLHLAYASAMTGRRRSGDARLLEAARQGEAPTDGQRRALIGTIHADEHVLHAPFSGAECVAYSYEIYHFEYTPSRTSGSSGTHRKVTDFSGLALGHCTIRSSQGDFPLLAYPFLSGFPEQKYKDEGHRATAAEFIRTTPFEKTVPLIGELTNLNRAMLGTAGAFRKDWRMADNDELGESTFEEQFIPPDASVCAFGIYSSQKRSLIPDTSTDSRSLLLVAGDYAQALGRLGSGIKSSRRVALWTAAPTIAVLAIALFAPWSVLRSVPGGSLIIEKQEQRLKEALGQNDLPAIADATRYVDPNLAFEEGERTPLMLAASVDAARILVERGARVDAHDSSGYSVLMNVAERGSPELLAFLVSRGANVNETHPSNPAMTALAIARERNTPAAVEALLKAGAADAPGGK